MTADMAVQQFCLRWNNHLPNFISVFTNLLTNEMLVDVTLAAEGKQLQAHKVVLSACSTYFQTLFTSNPCQHPIVILKDVKFSDLKTMVDFMYYGEVNVSQDQLPAILKTAETLKVKGLAEMPEQLSLSKSVSSDKDTPSPISPSVLRRKRLRKSSTGSGSEQTSEDTAASGSTDLIVPSPIKHEAEETVLRHEPSTESDLARESSRSFEDEPTVPPRNLSEEGENSTNIRWSSSSTEDNRPAVSSVPIPPQGWSFPEGFDVRSCEFPQYPYAQPRRKRSVNPQQDENFIAALEAVRSGGLGFCKAAKIYGVNNRTLWLEYKKRGYPLRPSTKSRAMVAEQQNVMRPYSTPNPSMDNCGVPKIKLPPLPPPNFHPGLSQSAPPPEYSTPLFNYSTL